MTVEHTIEADGTLQVTADFFDLPASALFRYWIEPELLYMWWPPEAEVEPHVGGNYFLRWPSMDWTVRGTITRFEAGRSLGFTWAWDHEPDTPETEVIVDFTAAGEGTRISLHHGPYPDSPRGEEMRSGHIEGWNHFLEQLQIVGRRKTSRSAGPTLANTETTDEMIDRHFGERDETGRRKATDRMIRRATEMMAEGFGPDEYMARLGRNILVWAGAMNGYPDPDMQAWVTRAADVLFDLDKLAAAEEQYLTGDDLVAARKHRKSILRFKDRLARRRRNRPTM